MASSIIATSGVRNAKLDSVAADPSRVALSHKMFATVKVPMPIKAMASHWAVVGQNPGSNAKCAPIATMPANPNDGPTTFPSTFANERPTE